MIEIIEEACGRKAEKQLMPMQPGDVRDTFADISAIQRDLGFTPSTKIDVGVPRFVQWYRAYHTSSLAYSVQRWTDSGSVSPA
jgi:UDP-glucuronate 4-epimerase